MIYRECFLFFNLYSPTGCVFPIRRADTALSSGIMLLRVNQRVVAQCSICLRSFTCFLTGRAERFRPTSVFQRKDIHANFNCRCAKNFFRYTCDNYTNNMMTSVSFVDHGRRERKDRFAFYQFPFVCNFRSL